MDSIFGPIFDAIAWLLSFYYSLIPELGISIILLTFTIMLILYPLTAKQARSMMAMQRVQPEIKKLQAKYKNDRQKLNEETMKFYQENKINPLAGCLPLLVQLPIFISLFRVLRDSQKYVPHDSDLFRDLCSGVKKCSVDTIHHLSFLGVDLQKTATDNHGGFFNAAPYFVLVGMVMITGCGFLQTRQSQKRTPAANKSMATVMRVLPVFFGLISLSFPAGLVLYFFVSNLWRLGQQELIFRRHGHELHGGMKGKAAIDVDSRERPDKAPRKAALAPPEDMVEEDEDSAPEEVVEERPAPRAAAPARVPAERGRGGGLRAMFSLPPPPDGNGGGAPSAPRPPTASRSTGSSGSGRPPPQRRRRSNKKKRKR